MTRLWSASFAESVQGAERFLFKHLLVGLRALRCCGATCHSIGVAPPATRLDCRERCHKLRHQLRELGDGRCLSGDLGSELFGVHRSRHDSRLDLVDDLQAKMRKAEEQGRDERRGGFKHLSVLSNDAPLACVNVFLSQIGSSISNTPPPTIHLMYVGRVGRNKQVRSKLRIGLFAHIRPVVLGDMRGSRIYKNAEIQNGIRTKEIETFDSKHIIANLRSRNAT